MNRIMLSSMLLAGVICLGMVSCSGEHAVVNAQLKTTPQQWEYKVVYMEFWAFSADAKDEKGFVAHAEKMTETINKIGADGWEYVTIHAGYGVFKRPKR